MTISIAHNDYTPAMVKAVARFMNLELACNPVLKGADYIIVRDDQTRIDGADMVTSARLRALLLRIIATCGERVS